MEIFNLNLFKNGININDKNISQDSIELTGIEQKIWVTIDGKKYLYKLDDEKTLGFNELVVSYLCHKLNIDCVNSYPAYDNINKSTGVLVESYLTDKPETQVTLAKLIIEYSDYYVQYDTGRLGYSVEEIKEITNKLNSLGYEIDKHLIENLKEMCLIDYLLFQFDRHYGNIEFLFSKNGEKGYIRLAPMFDNGRCLNYDCINAGDIKFALGDSEVCLTMSNRQCSYIDKDSYSKNVVYFICKEILQNKQLSEIYSKLETFDFDSMVDYIASIYPTKIPQGKIDIIKKTYQIRLNMLKKYLKIAKLDKDEAFLVKSVNSIRIKIPTNLPRNAEDILSRNAYNPSLMSLQKRNQLVIEVEDKKLEDDEVKEFIW